MAKVTNVNLLKDIDNLVGVAVDRTKAILNNASAKNSEVLNAADKIIKLRFALMEAINKEAQHKLDLEAKQLGLIEKRIKVELLQRSAGALPEGVVDEDEGKTYSRPFTSDMKPPEVHQEILKTG